MNRADIQREVEAVVHRADVDSAQWVRWFALADSAIGATLRSPRNEHVLPFDVALRELPDEWREMRRVQRSDGYPVEYRVPGELALLPIGGSELAFYTVAGRQLETRPGTGGTVVLTYWGDPESMVADDDENAIAAEWPDLYILYLTYRALLRERDIAGSGAVLQMWNDAIEEINGRSRAGEFGG